MTATRTKARRGRRNAKPAPRLATTFREGGPARMTRKESKKLSKRYFGSTV